MIQAFKQAEQQGLVELIDPSALKEAHENPRTITDEALDDLCTSLSHDPEMLLARPIILDAEKGDVVCGNMRLRAAIALGWDKVPVFPKRFESAAQRTEWMLRDNKEYGDWVPDEVALVIQSYITDGGASALIGFTDDEVAQAIRRATGDALVPIPGEMPNPTLAAEVVIEIHATRDALEEMSPILEQWQQLDGVMLSVVGA